ncbi:MAG: glutamate--tRNA ligase [Patescibacteria group bacterium]
MRTTVAGVPADALRRADIEERLRTALAGQGTPLLVLNANPEIVLHARENLVLRATLSSADVLLPDGIGLVWALRVAGHSAERYTGAETLELLLREALRLQLRVFIALRQGGLTQPDELQSVLQRHYPGLQARCVDVALDTTPETSDAELVIANFGAPDQELWLTRYAAAFPHARVRIAVGGAFDFLTGRLSRAPRLLQRLGLEWLWRLLLQPSRLWRIVRAVIIFPFTVVVSSMFSPHTPSNTVRVRFAPSPTGYLHIGGLRTALYNVLYARHHKGIFALRIEDTDRARLVPGAAEKLQETLRAMGLTWDEGPITQSERLDLYASHIRLLIDSKKAYPCFCSAEELDTMRAEQAARKEPPMYDGRCRNMPDTDVRARLDAGAPHVIRLAVPRDREAVVFTDVIRGEIRTPIGSVDDAVLIKTDGFPTYHFANVVDDHDMQITHVLRAEEWISSTPKHVLLYEAFGWTPPTFAHLPLLLNSDRSKLSKRQGDVAVEEYLAKGYLPEALINFIALLGWNPSGSQEIYTFDELVASFDLAKVNPSGAIVNFEKLDWLNAQYLKRLPDAKLAELAAQELEKAGLITKQGSGWIMPVSGCAVSDVWLAGVVSLEKERLVRMPQLPERVPFLFARPKDFDAQTLVWKKSDARRAKEVLGELAAWFAAYNGGWSAMEIETALKAWIVTKGYQNGDVLWPLRVSLTGQAASPGPFEISSLLEKDDVVRRIKTASARL